MKVVLLLILLHLCRGKQFNQDVKRSSLIEDENKRQWEKVLKMWAKMDASFQSVSEGLVQRFYPLAYKVATSSLISPNCTMSIKILLRGIKQMKFWAYQMVDSSGKLRDGVLSGNVVSLGDYDTCLDIDVLQFQGKYCRLEFEIPLPKSHSFGSIREGFPEITVALGNETIISEFAWHAGYLQTLNPQASVCVPSTCTTNDLQNALSTALQLPSTELNVLLKNCETKKDMDSIGLFDYFLIVVMASLFSVVLLATIIETYYRHRVSHMENYQITSSSSLKSLLYFSLVSNTEHLFRKDKNPDSIRVFYGMRVISTFWVILGNTYLILYPVAYGSYLANKDIPKNFWFQFITNSSVAMETFFFVSSALLAYQIIKEKEMNSSIRGIFIRRYIRSFIPLLAIIAVTCLLPLLNSGPVFKEIIGPQVKNCKNFGWLNFIYINNYIPFSKMCLNVSWFFAVDAQLFVLTIFVFIPFKKAPEKTLCLIGVLLVAGLVMTMFSQIFFELPPTTLSWSSQIGDMAYILEKSQFLPHIHLPTYCVGLIVGYILATKKFLYIPQKNRIILWLFALAVVFCIVFGVFTWNKDAKELGPVVSITYGSFYRLMWALALSCFTIECRYKNKSLVSRFLGSEAFVKFSRLSNVAYLTHMSVKLFYVGSLRRTISYDHITMVYLFVSISSISFTLSIILNLFFKYPLLRLEEDLKMKSTIKDSKEVK